MTMIGKVRNSWQHIRTMVENEKVESRCMVLAELSGKATAAGQYHNALMFAYRGAALAFDHLGPEHQMTRDLEEMALEAFIRAVDDIRRN